MIIRRAVPEDVSVLHKMLIDMYNRIEVPASPLSERKVLDVIKSAMETGIVIVAEVEGRISGPLRGMTNCNWRLGGSGRGGGGGWGGGRRGGGLS